ncbi:MAG: TonB-dependent receptor, partial [Gemmatimonadota bacterium]|nr:TonB-dependent receptor [Gemmatimonadota bacterium]
MLLASRTTFAQAAIVQGIVRSQSGRPIAGALLLLNADRDSTRSNSDGRFRISVAVSSATRLNARAPGFAPASVNIPPMGAGTVRDVTLVLSPLAQLAVSQIIASRERPLLNTSDAATGGAVEATELRALPTASRDPLTLAFNIPGVAQSTGFFGDAPKLTLNGINALYTQYTVDGLENTEGFLGGPRVELPVGALARLNVLVNSYTTALGRSASGVVDEETRAGGERWSGDLVVGNRPGVPLDARAPIVPSSSTPADFRRAENGFQRTQLAASGGGPIALNRTYAFGALEFTDENEDRVTSTARATFLGREARRTWKSFARLDHGWTPNQSTTLRFAGSHVARAGLGSGIVAPEADITTIRSGTITALTHRSAWQSGRNSNEAFLQFGTFRWNFPPTRSNLSTPQVTILDTDSIPIGVVGSSNFVFDEAERQLQARDIVALAIGTRHTVSFGADMVASRFTLRAAGTNPVGAYEVINHGDIP